MKTRQSREQRKEQREQALARKSYVNPEQTYLKEFKHLEKMLKSINNATPVGDYVEVPASKAVDAGIQIKRSHARRLALESAQALLSELSKQTPLTEDGQNLLRKPPRPNSGFFVLASALSRTSQGLRFLAGEDLTFITGKTYGPFQCEILDRRGGIWPVTYDAAYHQENMNNLSQIASELKGHRWEKTRKLLLILAASLLIVAGIVAALPTGGIGLAIALGGSAVLAAAAGFFAGKDTGLARAVREIKLDPVEDKETKGKNQPK